MVAVMADEGTDIITRRQALRAMVSTGLGAAGLLSLPGLLAGQASAGGASTRKPNIVFILIDDLATFMVGYNRRIPFLQTPNIDRIAA